MTPTRLRECLDALPHVRCPRCGVVKPDADYYRNKANRSGRQSHCKMCMDEWQAGPENLARRKAHRESPQAREIRKQYTSRPDVLARQRQARLDDWPRTILHGIRYRCKAKGIECTITAADIVVPETCPILGIPLVAAISNVKTNNMPSVDRIDPTRGYVPGNVGVISWYANRLKSDCADPEIFEALARYLRRGG